MSQKRKLIEEFHDPDYPQNVEVKKKKVEVPVLQGEERLEKIRAVARREFQKELSHKEQEINTINHRLLQSKRLLQRVRYAVVFNYYTKKNLQYSENELKNQMSTAAALAGECTATATSSSSMTPDLLGTREHPVQPAIHPSLKKLLGKKSIDYDEILKIRPPRQAAKTAKTTISEKLRSKKDEKKVKMGGTTIKAETNNDLIKIPRYIEPIRTENTIAKINSARGRNQYRHLIAVGNTSKYIGDEKSANSVTHKWLVYIKTKTRVNVEELVTKVRFFLHPSYKPNDVVEVVSPPFQLSRRGWGEFPLRVQLFFHSHIQQKPLQIFHNLILDKKLTGLQTMGAETVVELWLQMPVVEEPAADESKLNSATSIATTTTTTTLTPLINTSLSKLTNDSIIKSNTELPKNLFHDEQPSLVKSELKRSESSDEDDEDEDEDEEEDEGDEDENACIFEDVDDLKEQIENEIKSVDWNNGVKVVKPTIAAPIAPTVIPNNLLKIETKPAAMQPPPPTIQSNAISKSNEPRPPLSIVPDLKPPISTIKSVPTPPTIINQIKQPKLVKCLDNNGKVIFVELAVDPNNPKNIKIIRKPQQPVVQQPIKQLPPIVSQTSFVIPNQSIVSQPPKIVSLKSIVPNNSVTLAKPTTSTNLTPHRIVMNSTKSAPPIILQNSNQVGKTIPNKLPTLQQTKPPPLAYLSNTIRPPIAKTSLLTQSNNVKMDGKTVVLKNGQIFLIDSKFSPQSTLTPIKPPPQLQRIPQLTTLVKPKQESLLKPQISLLKSSQNNQKDTNSLITSNKPLVLVSPKIAKLPDASRQIISIQKLANNKSQIPAKNNLIAKSQNNRFMLSNVVAPQQRPDYRKDIETKFLQTFRFSHMRAGVHFLLKHICLVNSLASTDADYQMAFPFCVESTEKFGSLLSARQRSNEWYRAKYINRLLKKHKDAQFELYWSTKEIILFARQFGYTPTLSSIQLARKPEVEPETDPKTLQTIIKKELNREKISSYSITLNSRVLSFIRQREDSKQHLKIRNEDDIVIVDVVDDDLRVQKNPLPNASANKVCLPIDTNLALESRWVSDLCHDISVKLQPEEIVEGVLHSTTQRLLVQSLRSFLEDLLRRAYGCKNENVEQKRDLLLGKFVSKNDIRKAIATTPSFDFLSNKHLGVGAAEQTNIKQPRK